MLEYEFERVDCTGSGGYSFLGGVGLATVGHQEIIRKHNSFLFCHIYHFYHVLIVIFR